MITRKRTGQRLPSMLISSLWMSNWGKIWWLCVYKKRHLSSTLSHLSWLNKSILSQILRGYALCRRLKNRFLKSYAFLDKKKALWKFSTMVSIRQSISHIISWRYSFIIIICPVIITYFSQFSCWQEYWSCDSCSWHRGRSNRGQPRWYFDCLCIWAWPYH